MSDNRISSDGKFRWTDVPGLCQYIATGVYFARVKRGGKIKCQTLKTTVWTVAKNKLAKYLSDLPDAEALASFNYLTRISQVVYGFRIG